MVGFSAPIRSRGLFEEIAIAKVLLNTKPRHVGKFRDVGFPTSEKVWREKTRRMAIANKTCVIGKN